MNTTILETTIRSQASIVLNDGERQRCEVWTRVMGYHRPVSSFNTGKKGEFAERRYFEEQRCSAPATP
jgi:anaerobic ribonucleoside-triphosphate reductase